MKLCRYGKDGYEKPGVIDAQGKLRDLSQIIANIDASTLAPDGPLASEVFYGAYTWASWFWRRMVRETRCFTREAARLAGCRHKARLIIVV